MTSDTLWERFCVANSHFRDLDADSKLTVRGLKKLFDTAFAQGVKHGESNLSTGDANTDALLRKTSAILRKRAGR